MPTTKPIFIITSIAILVIIIISPSSIFLPNLSTLTLFSYTPLISFHILLLILQDTSYSVLVGIFEMCLQPYLALFLGENPSYRQDPIHKRNLSFSVGN